MLHCYIADSDSDDDDIAADVIKIKARKRPKQNLPSDSETDVPQSSKDVATKQTPESSDITKSSDEKPKTKRPYVRKTGKGDGNEKPAKVKKLTDEDLAKLVPVQEIKKEMPTDSDVGSSKSEKESSDLEGNKKPETSAATASVVKGKELVKGGRRKSSSSDSSNSQAKKTKIETYLIDNKKPKVEAPVQEKKQFKTFEEAFMHSITETLGPRNAAKKHYDQMNTGKCQKSVEPSPETVQRRRSTSGSQNSNDVKVKTEREETEDIMQDGNSKSKTGDGCNLEDRGNVNKKAKEETPQSKTKKGDAPIKKEQNLDDLEDLKSQTDKFLSKHMKSEKDKDPSMDIVSDYICKKKMAAKSFNTSSTERQGPSISGDCNVPSDLVEKHKDLGQELIQLTNDIIHQNANKSQFKFLNELKKETFGPSSHCNPAGDHSSLCKPVFGESAKFGSLGEHSLDFSQLASQAKHAELLRTMGQKSGPNLASTINKLSSALQVPASSEGHKSLPGPQPGSSQGLQSGLTVDTHMAERVKKEPWQPAILRSPGTARKGKHSPRPAVVSPPNRQNTVQNILDSKAGAVKQEPVDPRSVVDNEKLLLMMQMHQQQMQLKKASTQNVNQSLSTNRNNVQSPTVTQKLMRTQGSPSFSPPQLTSSSSIATMSSTVLNSPPVLSPVMKASQEYQLMMNKGKQNSSPANPGPARFQTLNIQPSVPRANIAQTVSIQQTMPFSNRAQTVTIQNVNPTLSYMGGVRVISNGQTLIPVTTVNNNQIPIQTGQVLNHGQILTQGVNITPVQTLTNVQTLNTGQSMTQAQLLNQLLTVSQLNTQLNPQMNTQLNPQLAAPVVGTQGVVLHPQALQALQGRLVTQTGAPAIVNTPPVITSQQLAALGAQNIVPLGLPVTAVTNNSQGETQQRIVTQGNQTFLVSIPVARPTTSSSGSGVSARTTGNALTCCPPQGKQKPMVAQVGRILQQNGQYTATESADQSGTSVVNNVSVSSDSLVIKTENKVISSLLQTTKYLDFKGPVLGTENQMSNGIISNNNSGKNGEIGLPSLKEVKNEPYEKHSSLSPPPRLTSPNRPLQLVPQPIVPISQPYTSITLSRSHSSDLPLYSQSIPSRIMEGEDSNDIKPPVLEMEAPMLEMEAPILKLEPPDHDSVSIKSEPDTLSNYSVGSGSLSLSGGVKLEPGSPPDFASAASSFDSAPMTIIHSNSYNTGPGNMSGKKRRKSGPTGGFEGLGPLRDYHSDGEGTIRSIMGAKVGRWTF